MSSTKPRTPVVGLFLRTNDQTILTWATVANTPTGDTSVITSYKIYRSTNKNLEDFEFVIEITELDLVGLIRTIFSETIVGYYAYGVTALNAFGESDMAIVSTVNTNPNLDILN